MLLGRGLWKGYPTGQALRGVTLELDQGETVGLVGESGSGKSTLARILCGLTSPDAGTVELDGTAYHGSKPPLKGWLKTFRKRVQLIFQDSTGSLDPRFTLYKTLEEPLDNYGSYSFWRKNEKKKRIRNLLEAVHLGFDLSRRYPHEMSGGQRQRGVIARSLAVNPDYLICDEPLSGLDEDTQKQILGLLVGLGRERRLGCLFISHDLSLCTQVSARLYVMFAGSLVEHLVSGEIPHGVHPYTRSLFEDLWEPDKPWGQGKTGRDFGIAEQGCRFRLQCPRRQPACQTEPGITEIPGESRHWVRCHNPEGRF